MTDEAEDQTDPHGTGPDAEQVVEQAPDAASEQGTEPAAGELPVAMSAGRGSRAADAPGENPYASIPQGEPAADGPAHRPSSLRGALGGLNLSRLPLSPHSAGGTSSQPTEASEPNLAFQPPAPSGPPLPQRLVKLVEERPEVGLGVAFLGGLILATILKRLGRR